MMLEYHTRRYCFLFKHWVKSFIPDQRTCVVSILQIPTNAKSSKELNLVVNYSSQIIFSKYSRKLCIVHFDNSFIQYLLYSSGVS